MGDNIAVVTVFPHSLHSNIEHNPLKINYMHLTDTSICAFEFWACEKAQVYIWNHLGHSYCIHGLQQNKMLWQGL